MVSLKINAAYPYLYLQKLIAQGRCTYSLALKFKKYKIVNIKKSFVNKKRTMEPDIDTADNESLSLNDLPPVSEINVHIEITVEILNKFSGTQA